MKGQRPEYVYSSDDDPDVWWAISGHRLEDLLIRAHRGEKPEHLYAEAYANAEHHHRSATKPEVKDGSAE